MAVVTKVGSFLCQASTGNFAVSGLGFTPKAILFWGNGQSLDGSTASASGPIAALGPYWGMAVSASSQVAIAYGDDFATGSGITFDTISACIISRTATTNRFAASLVTMDVDGFTVNFSIANATAYPINYFAFGGADLTVAIKAVVTPTTTGPFAVTGVGFKPDAQIAIGIDAISGTEGYALGLASGSTKRGALAAGFDATAVGGVQRNNKVWTVVRGSAGVVREADLTSFDTDGFTWNFNAAPAQASTVYTLNFKGGQYSVGTFLQKTSAGSQAYTGVGFQPVGLLCLTGGFTAGAAVNTTEQNTMTGAASSASARAVVYYGSGVAGVAELDRTAIYSDRADNSSGTLNAKADLTSLDPDGFTLNYSSADAVAREVIYFAVGNPAGPRTAPWNMVESGIRPRPFAPGIGR